ncbi:MAG: hypothetical protein C5S38_04920 [Candidatus Methanophagaceae archaeon]|nr:MAG: hypothetical protein C5S38_04920 [Methanophagales archaeon]KAF5432567.1 hypothetical protein C5S36_08290 [Methanophagales archaeon]
MTDFDIGKGKTIGIYAAVIGVAYLVLGVIEVFGGVGDVIPGDLFGGLALVVIAVTFLYGIKDTFDGDHKGLSFLIGGFFLSAVFGILYLLLMGADGLMFLLGEAEEFSVLADFRPAIWMFILSLPLAYLARGLTKDVTW